MTIYDGTLIQQALDCLSMSELGTFGTAYRDAYHLLPLSSVNIGIEQRSTDTHLETSALNVTTKSTGAFLYSYTADGWYSYATDKVFQSLQEVIEDETIYPKTEDEGEEGQLSLSITTQEGKVYCDMYLHLCPITLERLLLKLGFCLVSSFADSFTACTFYDFFGSSSNWRESFRACNIDEDGNLSEFTLSLSSIVSEQEAKELQLSDSITSESIIFSLKRFLTLMRKVKNALDAKATVTTTGTILVEFP